MSTPEGLVKTSVYKALEVMEMDSDIFWFERLNSGTFNVGSGYVKGCRNGTFDFVAVFPNKDKQLCLAFIETKRPDKPAFLSDSQEAFKAKYDGRHINMFFWLVTSGKEVKQLIIKYGYDRVKDMEL